MLKNIFIIALSNQVSNQVSNLVSVSVSVIQSAVRVRPLSFVLAFMLNFSAFAVPSLHADELEQQLEQQALPIQQIRALGQAYRQIKTHYVESTDDKTLFEAAIAGMVASLDSHSKYMDAASFARFKQDSAGDFAGIGVSVEDDEKGVRIVEVVGKSPAAKNGITVGDILIAVADQSLRFVSAEQAIELLAGRVGSKIVIEVLKKSGKTEKLALIRQMIHRSTVHALPLADGIGYIRIDSFTFETDHEFSKAVRQFSGEQQSAGLILDLRQNPGGILDTALEIADRFVESGVLIQSIGRTNEANKVYKAQKDDTDSKTRLLILVDSGTASAAEILAAALQGNHRAQLIGEKTYGKGSIQTIYELNEQSAVKLTSSYYLGPDGGRIDGIGLSPNITVKSETTVFPGISEEDWKEDSVIANAYFNLSGKP